MIQTISLKDHKLIKLLLTIFKLDELISVQISTKIEILSWNTMEFMSVTVSKS